VTGALRELLRGRTEAARQLQDEGALRPGDQVAAVVLVPVDLATGADPDRVVSHALRAVGKAVPANKALALHQSGHGVLLLPVSEGDRRTLDARISAIGAAARSATAHVSPSVGMIVGVGDARPSPQDAAGSYREARLAARTRIVLRGGHGIVHWSRLGVYQLVAELVDSSTPPRVVHAGLRALIGDPDMVPLLETLETYLDFAGNAQLAAERLNLHRGSLYYRLQRVEQLAGTNLKDGTERLSLHIELKIGRLSGAYLPTINGAHLKLITG
jgi:DNA-binding PucR family transcriptional regulator